MEETLLKENVLRGEKRFRPVFWYSLMEQVRGIVNRTAGEIFVNIASYAYKEREKESDGEMAPIF